MADIADLKIKVDSTDVRKGAADLDRFGNTAQTTGQTVDRLYASQSKLAQAYQKSDKAVIQSTRYLDQIQRELAQVGKSAMQIKALEIRMAAATAPTEELARDIRQVGAELLRAERNASKSGRSLTGLSKRTGLAAHHTQNLAFQLQDIVVGLQGGQRPMTVFMQQGSQIGGIMMQAGMGVGALTKAIVGMVAAATAALVTNPIFLGIAAAVIAATAAFKALQAQFNEDGQVEAYARSIGLTKEQIEEAGGASITFMDMLKGVWMTLSEGLNLQGVFDTISGWFLDLGELILTVAKNSGAGLYAAFVGSFNAIKITFQQLPAILEDIFATAINKSLTGVNFLVNAIIDGVNELAGTDLLDPIQFGQVVNRSAGAAQNAAAAIGQGYVDAFDASKKAMDSFGASVEENARKAAMARLDAVAEAEAATGGISERQKQIEQAQEFVEALEQETKEIGKTAIEIKRAGIEAAAAAAPTEELAQAIRDAGAAWEQATRAEARENFERNVLQPLRDELALVGLTGEQRELRALGLEEEAFKAKLAADGVEDVNAAWREYYELNQEIIAAESALEAEIEAAEQLKDELAQILDFLDNIKGGLGGGIEIIIRNLIKLDPDIKEDFKRIYAEFEKVFDDFFKGLGTNLRGIVGQLSSGAAIGGAVSDTLDIFGIGTSRTGAQIGGAIGSFAGPIGTLAGSILGGVIGGLVASTPRASATIETIAGGAMVASVRGNKGQLRQIAEGLAGTLINGLQRIADEFNGTIAEGIRISIGVRKDTFRVDPLGLGRTKGMISFDTEEEAIAYAIKLAIEQGAIEGIRQSTQNLLQAGDDLQAALQNALDFEGVFDRLLEKTDPLAFELKELDKEFERLTRIFEQAGATTEEFADLQRLYDIERQEALEREQRRQLEEQEKINDLILRIYREQGREAEELALTRQMERDAATEAERAILDQIYALEDFNRARVEEVQTLEDTIATMSQLATSLRAFREGLYGADQSVTNYKQALVDLIRVGSLASTGDIEALGQLQGVSQTFLASSRANARSLFEYQRDVALVASYVDQGIAAADEQVSAAEQQINLLEEQLQQLVDITTVLERIAQPDTPDVSILPGWDTNIAGGAPSGMFGENSADMEQLLRDALYSIARSTGQTANLLDRWDGDGQPDIRVLTSDYY